MIHEPGWKSPQDRRKDILVQDVTMLYKIINEIANVPNEEILIPADTRTRSKHGRDVYIMTNSTKNTNIHSSHKPYPSGTVCQKH